MSLVLAVKLFPIATQASDGYPVHNLTSGFNYTTVQQTIDANETISGDAILVDVGIYHEHVSVTKPVLLFGENRETTVIDRNGTGTVLQIMADNVTIANFTLANGGHGSTWLDRCIYGNDRQNILVEENTVMNATNGTIFSSFLNGTMYHNRAENLALMGLHLDGQSTNCTIVDNVVVNCTEGVDIERSTGNAVEDNLVSESRAVGIILTGSEICSLTGNAVTNGTWGL